MFAFIYGPPGSGKSTLAQALGQRLDVPWSDLDQAVERAAGRSIPDIFAEQGEAHFRQLERAALERLFASESEVIISLGGGALTDPDTLALIAGRGPVLRLDAPFEVLLARVQSAAGERPLLSGDPAERLRRLLASRAGHYARFPLQLRADQPLEELARQTQIALGWFRVRGMGVPYDVRAQSGGLSQLGAALRARNLRGPVALVSDTHVGPLYAAQARAALEAAGYTVHRIEFPAGEAHKNLAAAQDLWNAFLDAGLERGSTVVALGGGVVGDLAGFAAAAYLRGVRWVNAPTSLLAMVDASLGGKTGVDLPRGKNLVGAFHPPALVLADPETLRTLPEAELRSGLAEVIKHGVIAGWDLAEWAGASSKQSRSLLNRLDARPGGLAGLVARAMAVKIDVIQSDPYEQDRRAALNLGHTVGHAVELVSGFSLRHGECVAIGLVAEARLAERLGLAQSGLADELSAVLRGVGLPTEIPPDLDRAALRAAMLHDKKKSGGRVRFALPAAVGDVRVGIEMNPEEAV